MVIISKFEYYESIHAIMCEFAYFLVISVNIIEKNINLLIFKWIINFYCSNMIYSRKCHNPLKIKFKNLPKTKKL